MSDKIKEAFASEVEKDEAQINLAYAALLISAYLTRPFNIDPYLAQLDELAQAVQVPVEVAQTDEERVQVLNDYLFESLKFHGNDQDYYSPKNSFLNEVLQWKTGIPITLSVVYLEVGWRLDLPLWGIGMPGHFIVGYGLPAEPIYIDVFNRGRLLSEEDCLALARAPLSSRVAFRQSFLKPVAKTSILYRILLNLKQIYVRAEDWATAYNIVDLMLDVRPDMTSELRDRGLLAYRLNRLQAAIFDLKQYLFRDPDSPDATHLQTLVEQMEAGLLRLN